MDERLRNSASVFALAMALDLSAAQAGALPGHGHFTDGHGTIARANQSLTVKQSSTTGIINWNSFSIGKKNSVTFNNGSGATLNRVTGGNLSTIAGSLHATGSLYLVNRAGVIVSGTGRVVTGGSFVATTGNIGDSDRRLKPGAGNIVNKGTIIAGGTTSLSGRNVSDTGSIRASVVNLTATRDLAIDGHVVAQRADGTGGAMTVRARTIVVGADGTVDASASAIGQKGGTISVIARGTTTVTGTLKAEGGAAGTGGFIETSGTHLHVADSAKISTLAADGKTGTWLIDPQDFTIAASGGDITGAALSTELVNNDVDIQSSSGAKAGNGDIFVDDAVAWSNGHTLTLDAFRNIEIAAPITISGAGGLVLIDADTTGTGVNDGTSSDGDYFFDGGDISFTGGSGSGAALSINAQAYTLLYSMSDVQNINASSTTLQGDYALATSLDATGVSGWVPIGTNGQGTISNSGNGFSGTFDGLGNMISNLTVNIGSNAFPGPFGVSTGTIRDIGMVGCSVSGGSEIGGLLGYNDGGTVSDSYATGAVSGKFDAGGLVGTNGGGTVSGSYATGAVSGNPDVGGLVGNNSGTVSDSYATGAVSGSTNVGGLVGQNVSTISDSYATGAVSGSTNVGGLVGGDDGTITNSYWDTQTSGITNLTAGAGNVASDSGITGKTTAALSSALPSGFGSSMWGNVANQTTPYLLASGTTEQQVYVGSDSTDLFNLVFTLAQVQAINASSTTLSENYVLANSLDATGVTGWVPIGTDGAGNISNSSNGFKGTFDGFGNTISNLIVNTGSNGGAGLFGYSSGTIRDIGMVGGSVSGGSDVGGLVGQNTGTVSDSYATGAVSGGLNYIGGLVGQNTGTISDSYATGAVSGSGFVGGLVGGNDGGAISDSYATGAVNGTSDVGGFVGDDEGTISASYWDTQTSGITDLNKGAGNIPSDSGIAGKTTAQLQGALPGGFSNTVWGTGTGLYPYFLWQYPSGTPQAISGFAYTDYGVTGLNAGSVSLLIGGTAMGTVSTGANGYYYFLEAPGTISGSKVLTYDTDGVAFADNQTGSVNGFDIDGNYLNETTAGSSYATLVSDLTTAIGGSSAVQSIISALPNLGIDYISGATFNIDSAINLGSGTLAITANGSVDQIADISANKLLVLGSANYTLTRTDNAIATVAGHTTGSLGLISGEALTVGSVEGVNGLYIGGGASLATTSGGIAITQLLTADAHPLALTSASTISASGAGEIDAASLTGSSVGTVTLDGSNVIGDLGSFITNGHAFSLDNSGALDVTGAVNAGSGTVSLKTSSGNLAIESTITGSTVDLVSASAITESGAGIINATKLTGSSAGAVTLNGANIITDLGAFSTGGNNAFSLTDAHDLTTMGAVNAGTAGLTLTTTGSGHDIMIDSALTGGTVKLVSAATIGESTSTGRITATTLTGSSAGMATMTSATNTISDLGMFTSGGMFELTDDHDLTVDGTVNAGTHTIELTTKGSGHDIAIDAELEGGTVDLMSAATITESSAGDIDATTLEGSSVGMAMMNSATNMISDLGMFTSGGMFELTDDHDLTVDGTLNAGTHTIELTTKGSGHDIAIDAKLEGSTVKLTSSATISESSAGDIDATTLDGSSVGTVKLTSAKNTIADLGTFSTGGNNAFELTDDHALTVDGKVTAGTGTLDLTTVGSSHSLAVDSAITGGTVNLVTTGEATESSAGAIVASTVLNVTADTGIKLTSAKNKIKKLGTDKTKTGQNKVTL